MPGKNNVEQALIAKPWVTVITTVLNCVDHIEQAIQSVLGQTYDNVEYIIVDGASTDGTLEIIYRYKDNIDCVISEPDSGIYEGINKGIKLANGDYIIILNADDYFFQDAIENLVDKAIETGADIVAGHAVFLNPDDTISRRVKSRWSPETYLHATLRHEAMLVSKKSYKRVGLYDTSRKVISDRLWMVKAYEQKLKVFICKKDIYYFRKTGISSTGKNGQDIRHLEAFDYLSNLDSSLSEEALSKIARPTKLTIGEINCYISSCRSDKLRSALTCLLQRKINYKKFRAKKKIANQVVLAWKELLSSKRWQIGYLLTFFVPISDEEKEAVKKLSGLVTDYDTWEDNLDIEDEIVYLEKWLLQFQSSFKIFIKNSLRWKTGEFVVSFIKGIVFNEKSRSPAESIMTYLAKNKCK